MILNSILGPFKGSTSLFHPPASQTVAGGSASGTRPITSIAWLSGLDGFLSPLGLDIKARSRITQGGKGPMAVTGQYDDKGFPVSVFWSKPKNCKTMGESKPCSIVVIGHVPENPSANPPNRVVTLATHRHSHTDIPMDNYINQSWISKYRVRNGLQHTSWKWIAEVHIAISWNMELLNLFF